MKRVKASWTADSVVCKRFVRGTVKSVQAYCRLAMAIIATTQATNCHHRLTSGSSVCITLGSRIGGPPAQQTCHGERGGGGGGGQPVRPQATSPPIAGVGGQDNASSS